MMNSGGIYSFGSCTSTVKQTETSLWRCLSEPVPIPPPPPPGQTLCPEHASSRIAVLLPFSPSLSHFPISQQGVSGHIPNSPLHSTSAQERIQPKEWPLDNVHKLSLGVLSLSLSAAVWSQVMVSVGPRFSQDSGPL